MGGILLFIGGGLTAMFSSEGNMVINEGSNSNYIEDYHYMELAIINTSNQKFDSYTIFDYPLLKRKRILKHDNVQFEIEVINYKFKDKNC